MRQRTDRSQHLARLADRPEEAWTVAEALYRNKKDGSALRMLLDLAAVASQHGGADNFVERLHGLDNACPQRQLKRVGLPKRGQEQASSDAPVMPRPKKAKRSQPTQDQEWAEAQERCQLKAETIRQARALNISPRSLIKNRPSPSQRWKAPIQDWVQALYEKRYGRPPADHDRDDDPADDDIPF